MGHEKMTSAERIKVLGTGQRPDRVPVIVFALGFCARTVGYSIRSVFEDPEKSFWAQLWTREMYGIEGSPSYSFAHSAGWDFGGEIKFPTSEWEQIPTVKEFPVQSEEDVDRLELPDVKTAGSLPLSMEFSRICERHHMPVMVSIGSPFTLATGACEVATLCRWMLKKPEVAHRLLRLVTDHCLQVAQYWVDAFGAKRITGFTATPSEANQVISPKQFEEFALPYLKELHEKVLAMGVRRFLCHICGEQNSNLPYYTQVPMGDNGIVHFGHEVDLTTAIRYFGDTYVIAGNVEPQLIQNGTPQQVYEAARQCIEKAKYAPRGFILSPGCELPPMAPPYNVYMLKKAVNDFGWYD